MLRAKRDKDDPDLPVKLDGLTDEPPQRLVSRLMTWAGVALFMMGAAVIAARSEAGSARIARLFAPAPPVQTARAAAEPQRQPASDPLLLYETRRLADQVRQLAAEREALVERLAAVERTVGDVTASIPRQDGGAQRPVRVIDGAPAVALPATGSAPAAAPVPSPPPAAAAAAGAGAATSPQAPDSTAMRTEFGVDLAGDATMDALRVRWQQLRSRHGPVLEGLRPVVAVQEGRQGALELRLIVGPLSNANAAARLCATLSVAGVNCKPTVFDGQRLAVR